MPFEATNPFAPRQIAHTPDRIKFAGLLGAEGVESMREILGAEEVMEIDVEGDQTDSSELDIQLSHKETEEMEAKRKIEKMSQEALRWIEEEIDRSKACVQVCLALAQVRAELGFNNNVVFEKMIEVLERIDPSQIEDVTGLLYERLDLVGERIFPIQELADRLGSGSSKPLAVQTGAMRARLVFRGEQPAEPLLEDILHKVRGAQFDHEPVISTSLVISLCQLFHVLGRDPESLIRLAAERIEEGPVPDLWTDDIVQMCIQIGAIDIGLRITTAMRTNPVEKGRALVALLPHSTLSPVEMKRMLQQVNRNVMGTDRPCEGLVVRARIDALRAEMGDTIVPPDFSEWVDLGLSGADQSHKLENLLNIARAEIIYGVDPKEELESCVDLAEDFERGLAYLDDIASVMMTAGLDVSAVTRKIQAIKRETTNANVRARAQESLVKLHILRGERPDAEIEALKNNKGTSGRSPMDYSQQWKRIIETQVQAMRALAARHGLMKETPKAYLATH